MKIKKNIPYILSAAITAALLTFETIVSPNINQQSSKLNDFKTKYNISWCKESVYDIQKQKIEEKVQLLIANYIDNALNGTKRIIENKNKTGYSSAVRKELPGAPIHQHCLYGQYTQLNRAMQQMGDTIQIIPTANNAHMSTSSFKKYMTKLYGNQQYPNSIHRGHLYTTDAEYNRALEHYINTKTKNQKDPTNKSRDKLIKEFERNNYCASKLNPGTIIIVSSGHAVMYLGQGIIKNKKFISTKKGQAVCCSYNAEHTAIYLAYWDTKKSFATDLQNIITQKHLAQLVKTR